MSKLSRREMIRLINIQDNEGGGPGSVSGVLEDRMKELDTDEVREIYLDMFGDEAKAKTKKPKKVATVKGGGMIRKFASGGAALRGFGKVIK
mgnify:FL=1